MKKIFTKFKDFVLSSQDKVSSATIVLSSIIIITKILGFIKLRIIAHIFGTSSALDAFNAANIIPESLFQAFTAGAFSSAMIPLFTKRDKESSKRYNLSVTSIGVVFGILFFIISLILIIFAPQITELYLKDNINEEIYNSELLTKMTRYLSVVPFFLSVSSVITAGLQVKKKFLIASLSMPFHTLGVIIGAVLFTKYTNYPVMGLVYGTILGSILHLLVQIPGLFKIDYKYIFSLSEIKEDINYILHVSLPRMLGLLSEYVSKFHATRICLLVGQGALSSFQYAFQLYLIPGTMIGYSISQAIFPNLSHLAGNTDKSEFKKLLLKSLDFVLFSTVPISCIVLVLRFNIVRIFLSTGMYDWNSIVSTSWILGMFSIGIIFQSLLMVILRAYYSNDDTMTPFWSSLLYSIVVIVLNIVLSNLLSHFYGIENLIHFIKSEEFISIKISEVLSWFIFRSESYASAGGIALSISIGLILQVFVLFKLLARKLSMSKIELEKLIISKFPSAILMILVLYLSRIILENTFDMKRTLDTLIVMIIQVVLGVFVYLFSLYLLKDNSFHTLLSISKQKFFSFKYCLIDKSKDVV